ncbi:MAG: hypothetical protein AB8I08_26705 [Sandaracinaceae bacterium]
MNTQVTTPGRKSEVKAVREKYAKRIKARLGQPNIDITAARDGILDCYIATYFGGLEHGIKGYLGIDAKEPQVAQVAEALFKKRLRAHGSSFDAPSVEVLDRVKQEVDAELHFEDLPAELRGLHDQVCTLMLSKADGALEHHGDRSVVKGAVAATQDSAPAMPVAAPEPQPAVPRAAPVPSVSIGLRSTLAAYLEETAAAAETEDVAALRGRLAKLEKLVGVIADFDA